MLCSPGPAQPRPSSPHSSPGPAASALPLQAEIDAAAIHVDEISNTSIAPLPRASAPCLEPSPASPAHSHARPTSFTLLTPGRPSVSRRRDGVCFCVSPFVVCCCGAPVPALRRLALRGFRRERGTRKSAQMAVGHDRPLCNAAVIELTVAWRTGPARPSRATTKSNFVLYSTHSLSFSPGTGWTAGGTRLTGHTHARMHTLALWE